MVKRLPIIFILLTCCVRLSAQISQRGVATSAISTSASVIVNKPVGVVSGDLMIANISNYYNGTNSAATATGWQPLSTAALNNGQSTLLYKIAGTTEPLSYTFSVTTGSSAATAAIVAFTGVNRTTPFDVNPSGSMYTAASQSLSGIPSITTVTNGAAVIVFSGCTRISSTSNSNYNDASWYLNSPSPLSELFDVGQNSSNSPVVGAAWAVKPTSGATGLGGLNCITNTSTRTLSGITIALRPCVYAFAGPAMNAICKGTSTLALGGVIGGTATGGSWSDGGIGGIFNPNNTTLNATYTPPTSFSGNITLTLISTGGTCGSASSSKVLTVNPIISPSVSITSNAINQTICQGSSISFSASPVNGGIPLYQWKLNGVDISGATSNVYTTTSLTNGSVISVEMISNESCISTTLANSNSITVNVNPLPTAPAGDNVSRCGPGTVSLSVTPGADETIDWYSATTGGTLLQSGSSTYTTPSISVNTIYYAEAKKITTGCISLTRTAVTAMVNSLPSAPNSVIGASICNSGTATISATVASGLTIDWYSAATGGTLLLSGSSTYTTPSISLTTIYYAESRNTTTGCVSSTRTAVTATVVPQPTASAGGSQSICPLGTATVSGASSTNGTILWTENGGGTITAGSTTLTPVYTSTLSDTGTTVTLTMTVTSAPCIAATATYNVVVYKVPSAPAATNVSRCGSGTATITATAPAGSTIDWYSAATGGTLLLYGSSTYTTPGISLTTTYYAESRNITTGCISPTRTAVTVTVNALPSAPTSAIGATICAASTATISATAPAGSTIDWYSSSTGGSLLQSGSLSFTTPVLSSTTIYYAESRNTTTGCVSSSRTAVTATVVPQPTASVGGSQSICPLGTATVSGASSTNGTILWTENGGGTITSGSTTLTPVYTSTLSDTGTTVTLTMTVTSAPCIAATTTYTIVVYKVPKAPTAVNGSRCGPGTVTLSAIAGADETIDWYTSASGGSLLSSGTMTYSTPVISSTTTYYLRSRNTITGCVSQTLTPVTAVINPIPVVTCPGNIASCLSGNSFSINGLLPAGGTLSGDAVTGTVFNPVSAGVGPHNMVYQYTTAAGCSSSCEFEIRVSANLPVATVTASSLYIYSGTSTNIGLNSTIPNTQYIWTASSNQPGLTGYSSQSTPTSGPIRQQLLNGGTVMAEVTYTITPVLAGGCAGNPVTVVISVPNSTFCEDPGNFLSGSCIINMGVVPQTIANGLKPYGLLYELVNIYKIPVYWCINPDKSFQSPVTKVDQVDFTVDGVSFKGGTFIIPAQFVNQVRSVIDNWVAKGVVVYYSLSAFNPPVFEMINRMPKVVLDINTGDLVESGFYLPAEIPTAAYVKGGIPSTISNCDDVYVLPHAEPENWAQLQKDSLLNFINVRGWLYTSCRSVSGIENNPGMNFLTNNGLVSYSNHSDAIAPYNYSIRSGVEATTVASDPFMQFMGTMDGAIDWGAETVFVPNSGGWRSTTKLAIYDSNYVNRNSTPNVTYPNTAATLAYGRAFGDPKKGIIMYMGGHDFVSTTPNDPNNGTTTELVAAARVYGNFLLRAGIGTRPVIIPRNVPSSAFSGETVPLTVSVPPTQSTFVSYEWYSDLGGLFSAQDSVTNFTAPAVDAPTICNLQFKVTDICGRTGFYCTTILINPTIINNHISASQTLCAGIIPNTLQGTVPSVPQGNTFTYRWLMSSTSSSTGFVAAPGVNNQQNYTPPPLSSTRWFRREITSNGITVVSSSIQVTVKPTPTVTASATVNDLCIGQSSSLSSVGTGAGISVASLSLSSTQTRNIPDNNSSGIRDTITVNGVPNTMAGLLSISVTININHTNDQDIEVYLMRPGGTISNTANGTYMNTIVAGKSIALVADKGGSNNHFVNTEFSDTATQLLGNGNAPYTGSFKPETAFSTLTGNPNGDWILKVLDDNGTVTGRLNSWTIKMTFLDGVTYVWSSTPSGFSSSLQNPGTVTPTVSTTYSVTVIEPGNTCTATASLPIVVSPLSVAGTITGPTAVCSGGHNDTLTLSGYIGSIQWQSSSDNVTFNDIVGATSNKLPLSGITTITYYRVVVKSGTCSSVASARFKVIISPELPASVSISSSVPSNIICEGTSVIFTATPVNPGTAPIYQWKVNGNNVGTNSSTYTSSSLVNGDMISLSMISNATCVTGSPANSNLIKFIVNPALPVSVSISSSESGNIICAGSSVVFTATSVNAGSSPVYQWKLNGSNVGTNSSTYTTTALANGDNVSVVLTSNIACATGNPASSNSITNTVTTSGTWLGFNTNWNDATNWCGGIIPTASTNVVIPVRNFFPLITNTAPVCNNISILAGASLNMALGGKLIIKGSISNSGNFDAKNGTIELAGTSGKQIVPAGAFTNNNVRNLIIANNTADTSVSLRGALNILGKLSFTGLNKRLATNDYLTLKSSDTLTANVGIVADENSITGNVTVERYISGWRSWRLLSMPTKHNFQTIKQAWQENQSTGVTQPFGYGIQITSPLTNWRNLGFDLQTANGPSVKYYRTSDSSWIGIPATKDTLGFSGKFELGKAYMTFIRGDRTINTFNPSQVTVPTILREKGELFTGDFGPITIPAKRFMAIGSPYASALNPSTFEMDGIDRTIYLWDPKLAGSAGLGGIQTFLNGFCVPCGGSYSSSPLENTVHPFIESGQGFYVYNSNTSDGTFEMNEEDKIDGSFLVTREASVTPYFRINLTKIENGLKILSDGVLNLYDGSYSNEVDGNDAKKLVNFAENLSLLRNGNYLSIESRSGLMDSDTIYLNIKQMRLAAYRFEFIPSNITTGLQAILEDRYLNTLTPITIADTSGYAFTVSSSPASYATDRFRIYFKPLAPVPVSFVSVSASLNPDATANVKWLVENQMNLIGYEIERSNDGVNFCKISSQAPDRNLNASYELHDANVLSGIVFYRIKAISINGAIQYSNIVKLTVGENPGYVIAVPNPVKDRIIRLQFINKRAGNYSVNLYDAVGQCLSRDLIKIQSQSSSANISIPLKRKIASGKYQLKIADADGNVEVVSIMID